MYLTSANGGTFGSVTPIPVPAALTMFASGLAALGALTSRRKQKASAA